MMADGGVPEGSPNQATSAAAACAPRDTQHRRAGGRREQDDRAAVRLRGQGRNDNGVEENRQNALPRRSSHYRIRMTLSRGASASGSAKPRPSLKSSVKPVTPALCCARKYRPEPARNVPLSFTTL